MHLLRCLHFFSARFQLSLVARHVPGRENIAAEALPQDEPHVFFSCTPQAAETASHIPSSLLDMLHNQLEESVSQLIRNALPPSTLRVYMAG